MESVSALPEQLQSSCCIAGGGPAGMMLGLLLARAGIDVVVLEKHADALEKRKAIVTTNRAVLIMAQHTFSWS